MTSFRPRCCARPMRPHVYRGSPARCGLPAGHYGRCLSEQAYERDKAAKTRRQAQARKALRTAA